jgi:hypothetical protein
MSRESENGQKPRSHYTPCASTKRQTETGTRKSRHPPFFSNSAPDDLDIGSIDVDNDEHCLDHVPNTLHITHSASIELKHGSSDHLPPGLYPHLLPSRLAPQFKDAQRPEARHDQSVWQYFVKYRLTLPRPCAACKSLGSRPSGPCRSGRV